MLRIYTTLYDIYWLLYFKGHIQNTSYHSIVNMERKTSEKIKWKHWITKQHRNKSTWYHIYKLLYF